MRFAIAASVALWICAVVTAGGTNNGNAVESVALTRRQSHETQAVVRGNDGDGVRKVPWKAIVGKNVTVQGIAWTDSKGLGDRVILDGTTRYVDAKAHFQTAGRLVEVTGTFAKRLIPAARPGAQGPSESFEYYVLEDARMKYLETASAPFVVVEE